MPFITRQRKSIGSRILASLVLMVVVSASLSVAITVAELDKQLLRTSEQKLRDEAYLLGVQFRAHIDELMRDVAFVKGMPPVQGMIRAERHKGVDPEDGSTEALWRARLAEIFSQMLLAKPTMVQVRYIRANGQELVRVDRYGDNGQIRVVAEGALQDKSLRDYVKKAVALSSGEIYLSKISLNRENGVVMLPRQPVIRAATPIYTSGGELFGLIVINYSLDTIFDTLRQIADSGHQAYIAAANGEYLMHPDESKTFRFEEGEQSNIGADFPAAVSLLGKAGNGDVRSGFAQSHEGERVFALHSLNYNPDDPNASIIIAVADDFADSLKVRDALLNRIFYFLLLILACTVVLGLAVSRRIAAPLEKMREVIQSKGRNATVADLPVDAAGEAGELARAFNSLLRDLERQREVLVKEVSERRQAQSLLEQNLGKIAQANLELEQFTNIASHDLQEPLRTVRSFIELFEDRYAGQLDEQASLFLSYMNQSAARMEELINGLLEYSRIGKEAPIVDVDCELLVSDVCDDLASLIRESGADIQFRGLPEIRARAMGMRMLFQNLISNAIKFQRPGVVPQVRIQCEKLSWEWKFSVQDNGIGIPPEFHERIFLIFQRLHGRAEYSGTGIGLAHCKKIVEQHHGKIWVESLPQHGSRFYFTIAEPKDEKA